MVDLFAGCGGASRGLQAAGYTIQLAVDKDRWAAAALFAAGIPYEVTDLSDPVLRSLTLRGFQGTEGVWASPPCQPWSRAQTRKPRGLADDKRNGWPWTFAALDELAPRAFVGENVGAMATDPYLATIREELGRRFPVVESGLVDAADFGAAQRRVRLIVYAGPRSGFLTSMDRERAPARTMGDALPWLRNRRPPPDFEPAAGLVYYAQGQGRAASRPDLLDRPAPTVMTTEAKGTRASARSGWTFNGGPDRASDAAFLAVGRRRLTVRECAILQGLVPIELFGPVDEQYRQVGNAVHPLVARAAGLALRRVCSATTAQHAPSSVGATS